MQIRLPARYSDLTLKEVKVLMTSSDPLERVAACSSLDLKALREYPKKAITMGNDHLGMILKREESRHVKIIDLNGKSYGFIPDWEKFTLGEWIDIDSYIADFWSNADKIMSILYRPITRSYKEGYEIAKYTASEDLTDIKDIPADIISGALLFFLNTEQKLRIGMEASLVGIVREASSQKDGVGIA